MSWDSFLTVGTHVVKSSGNSQVSGPCVQNIYYSQKVCDDWWTDLSTDNWCTLFNRHEHHYGDSMGLSASWFMCCTLKPQHHYCSGIVWTESSFTDTDGWVEVSRVQVSNHFYIPVESNNSLKFLKGLGMTLRSAAPSLFQLVESLQLSLTPPHKATSSSHKTVICYPHSTEWELNKPVARWVRPVHLTFVFLTSGVLKSISDYTAMNWAHLQNLN